MNADTIAAPITAPGQGAVTLIRVSGPKTRAVLATLSPKAEQIIAAPRSLVFGPIQDGTEVLDWGMIAFFAAPSSFTGEDTFELNLHGGPYLQRRALELLSEHGVRMARAGEFSERAFLNGRIDLSQAEAVADLVAAESKMQAQIARAQLEGKLSKAVSELGEPLRNLIAEIEAYIDFPEEDIDAFTYQGWKAQFLAAIETLERYVASYARGRLYREGAQVVLAGLPNAGKSSLLNCLVGEDRAIVTPIPGTTRDSIDVRISLDGLFVSLWDTAGLVELDSVTRTLDQVEQMGIQRSWKRIRDSDLVLFVFDPTQDSADQTAALSKVYAAARNLILVASKSDLASSRTVEATSLAKEKALTSFTISAVTGLGVKELLLGITRAILPQQGTESILIANQRHFEGLQRAQRTLSDALPLLDHGQAPELLAVHLREALSSLDEIIGVTPTEDILGRIFSRFCIGK